MPRVFTQQLNRYAAPHAAASLEVWFCPFICDLTTDEVLDFLADCAERAGRLRQQGAEVVLLTCSELGLFTQGFLPSDTLAAYNLPHRSDSHEDFDLASYGVVKVLEGRLGYIYPDTAWEPKAAFTARADYYRDCPRQKCVRCCGGPGIYGPAG